MASNVPHVDVSEIPVADDPAPYILDVREDDEWEAGHIEGARHIPMMEVPARLAEIPTSEQVLVICRSGSRSARVVTFLNENAADAVNVSGGMQSWSKAGRPMTGPVGQPPQVV